MNFAITGVAGYVAPRHLRAIKDTGNNLLAAYDPHDSVGVLDSYFPSAKFFSEAERFDRYLEKIRRKGTDYGVDYLSICSPNYLHDSHVRMALRVGAHAICEKPLVISPWNLNQLMILESEYDRKAYCVLQLRYHPSVLALKKEVDSSDKWNYAISLSYATPRGEWYYSSWKGDPEKSGGLPMNIGIHFFDMLLWIFGDVLHFESYGRTAKTAEGSMTLKRANVHWFLSTDPVYSVNGKPNRSLFIDGKEFNFSDGFDDLHTRVYEDILNGNGFGILDAKPSIELTFNIRKELECQM